MKDFQKWHEKKEEIQHSVQIVYFHEREIWWMHLGSNIGFEEDGKGESFARPVLILKQYNPTSFLGVPLSTTQKSGKYYYHFSFQEKDSVALLSQLRLFDAKRLYRKMGRTSQEHFLEIRARIRKMLE